MKEDITMHDCHTHTIYSADVDKARGSSIDEMAQTALDLGLKSIAFTDHLEIQTMLYNTRAPLDSDGIRRDVYEAKDKYKGKLNIIYGVEIGQMMHSLEISDSWLKKYDYEYIIGSVHNVKSPLNFSVPEFFEGVSDSELVKSWEDYIGDLVELVNHGGFHVLAHITYPLRYYKLAGKDGLINIEKNGNAYFEPVFKAMIDKDIALEVNTSGLRQKMGCPLPHKALVGFYYDMGGRDVSFGSDAHYACDIGKGIKECYEMCRDIGFEYGVFYENGEKKYFKL